MLCAHQVEEEISVMARCLRLNGGIESFPVFPLVFHLDVLHVHLCSGDHNPYQFAVISPQSFHGLVELLENSRINFNGHVIYRKEIFYLFLN